MNRRVVLLGATGMFGQRLAEHLATWSDLELVLAARSAGPLADLQDRLAAKGAVAAISTAVADRDRPATLVALSPWALIDAAGPFQGAGYDLARAAVEAGAHWIDLADARGFVSGFSAALNDLARDRGVLAVTGASSTPAITDAALGRMTAGWRRVDRATSTITPGAQKPGLSLTRTVLAQAGQRVRCFEGGDWVRRPAWGGLHWQSIPGLGRRLVALADTPDLDALPKRAGRQALFFAGVEPALLQRLVWVAAWLVRLRLLSSLEPLAAALRPMADLISRFGVKRGGMAVVAEGIGPDGAARRARWSLVAQADSGPAVPSSPAAAVLRALLDGRLSRTGAVVCLDLVSLDDILAELAHLPIAARLEGWSMERHGLFPRALGDDFDALPASVRAVHAGGSEVLVGRAVSAGRGLGALVARVALGLPGRGAYDARVEIAAADGAEIWTRQFGRHRFRSRLSLPRDEPGQFEERLGPVAFRFSARCDGWGFRWIQEGWRLGAIPLPAWLGPRVRARSFDRDGVYRFSVVVAHPWLGVMAAYAGRLTSRISL